MRTIISTERPALQATPTIASPAPPNVYERDLSGMKAFAAIDAGFGTAVVLDPNLSPDARDGMCEIVMLLLTGGCAPSLVWVQQDGEYAGTVTRPTSDGLVWATDIQGTVNLALIGVDK